MITFSAKVAEGFSQLSLLCLYLGISSLLGICIFNFKEGFLLNLAILRKQQRLFRNFMVVLVNSLKIRSSS